MYLSIKYVYQEQISLFAWFDYQTESDNYTKAMANDYKMTLYNNKTNAGQFETSCEITTLRFLLPSTITIIFPKLHMLIVYEELFTMAWLCKQGKSV